jgi:hypothetical protein
MAVLQVAAVRAACPEVSFVAPAVYPAGPRPNALASADLDADGNADLIVGNAALTGGGGGVAVLMGNPGGTFRPPILLLPAASVTSVTVADFDGDRFDDAAVIDIASGSVLILMNRGGRLSLAGTYSFGAGGGTGLVAGDFDGDGHPDLLLIHGSTSLFTLRGRGDGTFEPREITPAGNVFFRSGAAVADVNKDGRADLVLASDETGNGGAVLLFAGDSTTFLKDPVRFAFTEKPSYPTIADINGDGALDVVVTFTTTTRLGFVRGLGLPGAATSYSGFGVTPGQVPILIADFDGDRLPDVIVQSQNQIILDSALGSLQFSPGQPLLVPGSGPSNVPLAIDVDHDGRLDVIVASLDGVTVLRNLGGGHFDTPGEVGGFGVGDFNGDGRADLLDWKNPSSIEGGLVARLATPSGSFATRSTAAPLFGALLRILDLNGDGKLDVVVFERMRGGSVPSNRVFIALGRGDGTFNYLGPVTVGHSITSGSVADIDGDGHLDLIVGNGTSQPAVPRAVSVAYGHGDGTFDTAVDLDFGSTGASVVAGDFDGDGRPDLLLRRDNAASVVVLNAGAGHFRNPVTVANLQQYFDDGDINGDGKDDFVEIFFGTDALVRIFFSNGDGTFVQGADVPIYQGSVARVSLRILDIDRDGRRDVAVGVNSSSGGMELVVLLNRAGILIPQKPVRTTTDTPDFGDFDGDGTIDLLDFGTPRLARCAIRIDRRRAVSR